MKEVARQVVYEVPFYEITELRQYLEFTGFSERSIQTANSLNGTDRVFHDLRKSDSIYGELRLGANSNRLFVTVGSRLEEALKEFSKALEGSHHIPVRS